MELSADGSGVMPSDLDAQRRLVGCLFVDPHGSVTLPIRQFFDPHHCLSAPTERDS
jgi:hypothetical protein